MEELSRNEALLDALVNGTTPPEIEPKSRMEAYLQALCDKGSKLSEEIGDLSKLSTYGNNVVDILLKLISGGNITPEEKEVLETYNIFVPQNVSDEWNTHGTGSTGASRVLNISTAEFLELFYDGFVTTPPSGMTVTKTSIGKDQSGQYDMWEYDFCPSNYTRTILLSSGMHTYELSASFGLANFIGHLYTDTDNEAFDYIRKNVRVKVIPIVNPWGFNQNPKTYGNINGVNPNRNFDVNGQWNTFPVYTPQQNEWNVKGDYPFSEAETKNLAKWAIDNYNAEFWIDCHTGLGYADKDLWLYYSSDSVILDRINNAISKIEAWFKETYGKDCVTTRTIDESGGIRLWWAEKIIGLAGFTLEQAPHRTTFGTAENNDSGDISNYSTNISTFVQEFLLEKYRNNEVVNISSVLANDVAIAYDELSKTVEVTIAPLNTTQNHFKWTSSDENVVEVYGGTNKAVLVNKGVGKATITVTNRHNSSVHCSFNVNVVGIESYTITNNLTNVSTDNKATSIEQGSSYVANLTANEGYLLADVVVKMGNTDITNDVHTNGNINIPSVNGNVVITAMGIINPSEITNEIKANISAIDYNISSGYPIESDNRITTELIPVEGGSVFTASCTEGYYLKTFEYDENTYPIKKSQLEEFVKDGGTFDSNYMSYTPKAECRYVRILIKKSDNSVITNEEFDNIYLIVNDTTYTLIDGNICEQFEETTLLWEIGTVIEGVESYNTKRIRTDYIPVDGVESLYLKFSDVLLDDFIPRFYDKNKNYIPYRSTQSAYLSWCDTDTELNNGWCNKTSQGLYKLSSAVDNYTDVAYVRFVMRHSDDRDITDVSGAITIGCERGYRLTAK